MSESKSANETLDDLLASAPTEISPSRDLWPQIATQLERPRPAMALPKYRVMALPAAIVAALLLVLLPRWQPESGDTANDTALQAVIDTIVSQHQADVASLAEASLRGWQRVGYRTPIDAGLAELRTAAMQILSSLRANPRDKQLWQLWLWVQRREIELLTQGQRLPEAAIQGDTL